MTNTVLNDAIINVLTHQFKKDVPKSHRTVENAGYVIYKVNGHFVVKNPKTDRNISVTQSHRYRYRYFAEYGYYSKHQKYCNTMDDVRKIDFVNCLNTPINSEYYSTFNAVPTIKKKYSKYRSGLHDAKWDIDYYNSCIERYKKEIEKLNNELIRCARERGKAEEKLSGIRKELGLTKTF